MWFKFRSAWFYFLSKYAKEKGKKITGKKINVDREVLQRCNLHVLILLGVTLCNHIAGEEGWGDGGDGGRGAVPILRKKLQPISIY